MYTIRFQKKVLSTLLLSLGVLGAGFVLYQSPQTPLVFAQEDSDSDNDSGGTGGAGTGGASTDTDSSGCGNDLGSAGGGSHGGSAQDGGSGDTPITPVTGTPKIGVSVGAVTCAGAGVNTVSVTVSPQSTVTAFRVDIFTDLNNPEGSVVGTKRDIPAGGGSYSISFPAVSGTNYYALEYAYRDGMWVYSDVSDAFTGLSCASEPEVPVVPTTWTPYCTGGSDPNGNNWQWWQYSNTNPVQYQYLRAGDGACVPPTLGGMTGAIAVSPPSTCTIAAGASTCSANVTWNTQNAQHSVAQSAGPLWPSGANIDGPTPNSSGSTWHNLPAGSYIFVVHGYNGTAWVELHRINYTVVTPNTVVTPTWTPYCTGGSDPNGNNWQWWQYSNTNPVQYQYIRPGDGTCTAASATPDLTVSGITPTSAVAGTPTTFSATVTNTGGGSTNIGFQNFYQVRSNTTATAPHNIFTKLFNVAHAAEVITDLAASNMGALAAGGSGVATQNYTFPAAGTYGVRVCADKANSGDAVGVIAETDETNNCGGWTDVNVSAPLPCNGGCPPTTYCKEGPPDVCVSQEHPVGNFISSCSAVSGFAIDATDNSKKVTVELYDVNNATGKLTALGSTVANQTHSLYNGYGFSMPLPESLQDGTDHSVLVYAYNVEGDSSYGYPVPLTIAPGIVTTAITPSGDWAQVINCASVAPPTVSLSANPTRVRKDTSTKLTWSTSGAVSCSVTGQNGFSSTALSGSAVDSGPLDAQTTFALTCTNANGSNSASAVVNLLPSYIEQ